jgi:hypothetical protein
MVWVENKLNKLNTEFMKKKFIGGVGYILHNVLELRANWNEYWEASILRKDFGVGGKLYSVKIIC